MTNEGGGDVGRAPCHSCLAVLPAARPRVPAVWAARRTSAHTADRTESEKRSRTHSGPENLTLASDRRPAPSAARKQRLT